ncbi:hypothetical protein Patl1_19159 [Pistacia atlantica]|uniref:Uncharacterized protein n=1 Tax=Pistacia atlantica TaxID=434234 RepID=A0ACC1C1A2_9ROSI|nr:hypothetical protein Patl1_19159 [Pistacia atlantica]
MFCICVDSKEICGSDSSNSEPFVFLCRDEPHTVTREHVLPKIGESTDLNKSKVFERG